MADYKSLKRNGPHRRLLRTLEFDEMWGSTTTTPSTAARMGSAKLDDTPHEFNVNSPQQLGHILFRHGNGAATGLACDER